MSADNSQRLAAFDASTAVKAAEVATDAAEAAEVAFDATEWLHRRGVGSSLDQDRTLLSEEQRAHRSSRPRNRRWKQLERLGQHVDVLTQRQAEAGARLQEAEQALTRAPSDDARTLADWIAGGEKGSRPTHARSPNVLRRTGEAAGSAAAADAAPRGALGLRAGECRVEETGARTCPPAGRVRGRPGQSGRRCPRLTAGG